jgi:hypothetical protein
MNGVRLVRDGRKECFVVLYGYAVEDRQRLSIERGEQRHCVACEMLNKNS